MSKKLQIIGNIGGTVNAPYIGDNGNWFEWDTETNAFVDSGVSAKGDSGVYCGDTAPTDPSVKVWVKPNGEIIDQVSKEYVDDKISTFVRPNLLDNWYFKNPVNQRNVSGTLQITENGLVNATDTSTIINTSGYFIDRWILTDGTVEITDNGLVLNGTMIQKLEFAVGQDTKASILTSTGLVDGTYDDIEKVFTVTSTGDTIIAAKLELGDTQTLSHKDNSAWVLNEIPDYGEQLAKCQRFYIRLFRDPFCNGYTGVYGTLYLSVSIPVTMRAVPSIVISNSSLLFKVYNPVSLTNVAISSLLVGGIGQNIVYLTSTENTSIKENVVFCYSQSEIALSADM